VVNRHGTDILLQNEPDWITWPYMLFHHERTGCADRGNPRDVQLRPRCEDAHPTRVRRILLRQDEGRFAEIEFAGNLLHALGRGEEAGDGLPCKTIQPQIYQPESKGKPGGLGSTSECRAGAGSVQSGTVESSEAVCSSETSVRKRLRIVWWYTIPGAIPGCTVGENVYSNHGCGSNLNSWIQWKPLETSRNLFRSVN